MSHQNNVSCQFINIDVIFRPPWTEKRACRRYFPSVQTEVYVLQALFSRDGRLSKREAIFRPPLTKMETI